MEKKINTRIIINLIKLIIYANKKKKKKIY